ncbi:helicase [Corynebacterium suranareeae]|uniref:Helicase n=1 Tax=Corynebacterium suranareeae TaxID=2506452 RepID=A0A160PMK5_9CORY|nr:DEAD/DEAH box helicase [Corynebacterium suranareeae]BAU94435.1 helicase [Corynebacterium suranareeae]
MAHVLPTINVDSVHDCFGSGALKRGRDYAHDGMVLSLGWNVHNSVLSGSVMGSGNNDYDVDVYLRPQKVGADGYSSDDTVWGVSASRCTCPVGVNCKHGVAVCYATMDHVGFDQEADDSWEENLGSSTISPQSSGDLPRQLSWINVIEDFIGESGRAIAAGVLNPHAMEPQLQEIALSIDVKIQSENNQKYFRSSEEKTLTMQDYAGLEDGDQKQLNIKIRPLRKSDAGNWVKGQISWSVFEHSYLTNSFIAKEQFLAMNQLVQLHQDNLSFTTTDPEFDTRFWSDPRLWDLLKDATATGIPLIGQLAIRNVEIAEAAEVLMDFTQEQGFDGAELMAVTPRIVWQGEYLKFPRIIAPSAIVQLEESTDTTPGLKGKLHARIIPLKTPLSYYQREMIRNSTSLALHPKEQETFFEEYFPTLRNVLPVFSSDHSIEFPTKKLPSLEASVNVTRGKLEDFVVVDWAWRDTAHGLSQEHRDAVMDSVRGVFPDVALTGNMLKGTAVPPFIEHVADKLDALDYVTVKFVGERPNYRELSGDPFVGITTTSTDNDWFDLNFDISIDEVKVPFSSVFIALSQDQDTVLLDDGSYFSLDHPSFDALRGLLAEAQDLEEWDAKSQRVHRNNAGLFEDLADLADEWVPDVALESWLATVRELANIKELPRAAIPTTLNATLRLYQEDGFRWLALLYDLGLGGILADDMGLGKTIQTLALIAHARDHKKESTDSGFLVIAPSSVLSVWRDEAARFLPHLSVEVLDKTAAKRKTDLPINADIVITSYTIARIDEELLASKQWSGIIVDEAQFIKNHTTRSFRAIRSIAQQAKFRLAITGTPMENSLSDLWSLSALTAPGLFPKFKEFKAQFINPIESGSELSAERMAHLQRRIAPFMLRRAKEDVATDLPEKIENTVVLPLTAPHRKLYDAVLQRERKKVLHLLDEDMDANRMSIFRSLTLLRMLALDPFIVDEDNAAIPSTKLEDLLERLEVLTTGEDHQVIVFSQFTSFLKRIAERLEEIVISYSYLDGATRNRSDAIKEFRDNGASVFLISLKAGGFGLTLTEADCVFLLDPWWNPAAENQAIDRAHRIGQTSNVMVYRMVSEGTIEEKVLQLQKKKAELFDALTTGSSTAASGLSVDDVRELFSLD